MLGPSEFTASAQHKPLTNSKVAAHTIKSDNMTPIAVKNHHLVSLQQ